MKNALVALLLPILAWAQILSAADSEIPPGEASVRAYLRSETERIADACLSDVHSLEDWTARREQLREQLFEMLSLSPLPPKGDLQAVVTRRTEGELFNVENLQFQSMPGLYVTGNLYLPKHQAQPAPAILYLCGHADVQTNGISYGNKVAYQHHGEWFARNGYVCLTIDTVQLGEIQGVHHGTYREGMWWWNARGYTPAGVEAWNSIRALDYLQSRPEVDGNRLGVTGRSGGGAYSWWVTALDDRIKAAAPVAGMTDLHNHVIDGTVDGHCDCMFIVNTYRWDYPAVAALAAPRPLLIANSDKDSIFPLDGIVRLHSKVARIYELFNATNQLGLLITEGPHHDTQDLQIPVFRWFNRFLKEEDPLIETAAKPFLSGQQLKVFETLPSDERTSRIQDSFVPTATPPTLPVSASAWAARRKDSRAALVSRVFRAWPHDPAPLNAVLRHEEAKGPENFYVYEFLSQHDVPLRLYVLRRGGASTKPNAIRLTVLSQTEWRDWAGAMAETFPNALREESVVSHAAATSPRPDAPGDEVQVYFAPRGIGMSAWDSGPRKDVQIRRRFMLLGETVDSMRVWDIRRAIQVVEGLPETRGLAVVLAATEQMAVNVVYAALFEPEVRSLDLARLSRSHRIGPDYLNVLRFLDVPEVVALAAEHRKVRLRQVRPEDWAFPMAVVSDLGWPRERLVINDAE